jgi:uncharacterized membrane protein YhaH (DUF805 family)
MSTPPPLQLLTAPKPPLWAPYYRAPIGAAFARFWKKYATFSGRASRSEYWWWALIDFVVVAILEIMLFNAPASTASLSPLYYMVIEAVWVVSLGALIPNLAVMWRRLHDTNRSGRYYLFGIIPIVGSIILLVFLASAPNPAGARFDRPPA